MTSEALDYSDGLLALSLGAYLKRCRAVTEAHQAKGEKWTIQQQMLKIYEEAGELHHDLRKNLGADPTNLEIFDVVLSAITMCHLRGMSDRDIAWWFEQTLQKIEARVQP